MKYCPERQTDVDQTTVLTTMTAQYGAADEHDYVRLGMPKEKTPRQPMIRQVSLTVTSLNSYDYLPGNGMFSAALARHKGRRHEPVSMPRQTEPLYESG